MSNPTSNFGWVMPDATDLVTNLPADFEVFGQAVDTSMANLKGGTTGQILSKTSATDMDFTWIANDQGDITAVGVTSPITGGGTSGAVTIGIQDGTTLQKGALQLTDSTSSTSTTTGATPNSVKSAYDLAGAAIPKTLTTTTGDTIYASAANTPSRLGIGSTGQALSVVAGIPAWAASATSTLTTTGDLLYASAANTLARRSIGTTGQVLTVASGLPTWATPTSGSLTLLGSTALSGLTTYTFSSINQNYKTLFLQLVNAVYNTTETVSMNLNGIANNAGSVVYSSIVSGTAVTSAAASNWVLGTTTGSTPKMNCVLSIYDYANTSQNLKQIVSWNNTAQTNGATGTTVNQNRFGVWQASSAGAFDGIVNISSLTIYTSAGSFNSGNVYLYGVN